MGTQPVHRAACTPGLMEPSAPLKVWGNSCALCLPVEGTTGSSPVHGLEVAVFKQMAMESYQQLSATHSPRVRAH